MKPIELKDLLNYDPLTGEMTYRSNGNPLKLQDNGTYIIYNAKTKKKSRILARNAAYILGNDKDVGKDYRVLHRNLDSTDFRLRNLLLLPRMDYLLVFDAVRNLEGDLLLKPRSYDKYDLVLQYRARGVIQKKVYRDEQVAKRAILQKKLEAAKTISKYCIFED